MSLRGTNPYCTLQSVYVVEICSRRNLEDCCSFVGLLLLRPSHRSIGERQKKIIRMEREGCYLFSISIYTKILFLYILVTETSSIAYY